MTSVVIVVVAIGGCAHPKPPVSPPAPNLQPRVDAADALVRAGCFDCLAEALREYDAVRLAPNAAPAIVEAATMGSVRTAILLDLRERELGTTDDGYLQKARQLLQGRDDLAGAFASAFDVAETVRWRGSDGRGVSGDAQLTAMRRLAQNRDAWKALVRDGAGKDVFSAYLWLSFACSTGETRLLTPAELVAPFAALKDAPLLMYKTAACPGTRDVPPRQSAVQIEALADLLEREPRFIEIEYERALHAVLLGQLEQADELLQRAYRWHPKWPAVTMSLAGVAIAAEDFAGALQYYDASLELVPGLPLAMLQRVKMLSFLGRNEEAIQYIDTILDDRWNRGEEYYWRAWNNMQLTRNDQAWTDVEAAWKLYVNSDVAKLAGMIAYRRQQVEVARQKFEEGRRMRGDDCELGYYLGLVNAELRLWPPTAEVFVATAACLQNAQKAYSDEIAFIQASRANPERKARQVARREKLIRDAERMIATSWFNTAVAYYNLARKAEARQFAERVSSDAQFGERARELLSRLDK